MLILIFFLLAFLLSIIIMLLANLLGVKRIKDQEKTSPFECGFNPVKKARVPFSLRFYIVTIIFLIFDVELAILTPLGILLIEISFNSLIKRLTIIIILLIVGLLHE